MPSSDNPLVHAPPGAPRWLFVGWLTLFLVGTDLFIVSAFLPWIGHEQQVAPASTGMLVSAFSLCYAIGCPILGRLAERYGLRRLLLVGVCMLALANGYTAWAPTMPHLIMSRMLAGLAAAAISPMLYAMTAERAPAAQRAARLAQINSGLILALCLGAPLGLLLGNASHWRLVFLALSAALMIMLPVNAATWSQQRQPAAPAVTVAPDSERLLHAWPLLLGMTAWAISVYATYTLLTTALRMDFHATVPQLALTLLCFGAGASGGVLAGGRLADRLGESRQAKLALSWMMMTLLLCLWAYRLHLGWLLDATLCLLAFAAYGCFPALQACAARAFHARRPTVLGMLSSALYVGITLGAALGSAVFERAGMPAVLLMAAAVAAAAACLPFRRRHMPPISASHPAATEGLSMSEKLANQRHKDLCARLPGIKQLM